MRSNNLLEHIFLSLQKYWRWWVAPMVIFFVLSAIYNKLLATKTYTARQSLILRDDLMGDAYKPSRFESEESLKSAQETVLEIARKPQVVKAVLEQLGPTSSFSFGMGSYPSTETIENVQGNISLMAPNGAEFGKTEAVVLSVKTVNPERSRKFVNLLLDQIDSKLNEVRHLRLESMQKELSQASVNASEELQESSRRLQDIEMSFGADITTIRGLNDPQGSGGFDLKLNQIRLEQRQAAAQLSSAKNQRELLRKAEKNGGVEFATSNELLQMQPALQGIMTNLSTAMAQLAIDEGRYTSRHPVLMRSRRAVKMQKQQLFNSIGTTLKGLDSQIENLEQLDDTLGQSVAKLEKQLQTLSEQRVPYATLEEEVKKKAEVYNDVEGRLAKVQSYARSTEEVAMLTRVDAPQVSSRPDQLGTTKAALLGGAIGLMLGLGLVALIAPPFIDPRTQMTGLDPLVDPSASLQQPSSHASQTSQYAAAAGNSNVEQAHAETAAESRLRSVTARQREQAKSPLKPESVAQPSGTSVSENSLMSNALDSVIPDSVAKHMAELKRGLAEGISEKKIVEPDAKTPANAAVAAKTKAPKVSSSNVEAPKAPASPSLATPKVAEAEVTQPKIAEPKIAEPKVAQSNAPVAEDPKTRDAAGIAKQIQVSKREMAKTYVTENPIVPAPPVVQNPSKDASVTAAVTPKSKVSNAEVVAAFKSLQDNKTISTAPTHPSSASTTSKDAFKETVVPERRPSLSSFATSASSSSNSSSSSNVPAKSAKTTGSSENRVADRVRSPEVPESITNGRITAESLLKSAEQKKDPDKKDSNKGDAVASKQKFSATAHESAAARAPESTDKESDGDKNSRIPSITDYARSLDRQLGSVGEERIAVSSDLLGPNSGDSESSTSQRPANVRPVDIAKSFDDPIDVRESVSGVSASEANAESTKIEKPRTESLSDFVGSMDNSIAGLMKEAKKSETSLDFPNKVSPAAVSPSEKVAAEPKAASTTTITPRDEVASATIPAQIRELSESFSSFARPSNSNK